LILCSEHTGKYTYPLLCISESLSLILWVEDPSQIKYSSGVRRGKNDRVDARMIARYAEIHRDKLRKYIPTDRQIHKLKELESQRELFVVDRAKYKAQLKDHKGFMHPDDYLDKNKRLVFLIESLDKVITQIEEQIQRIINSSPILTNQMQLLTSIEGIGNKVALKVILESDCFSRFKNARQFACHAGVAPFEYSSGSSIRSKRKVSHRANKDLKTLLHLAALAVIRKKDSDLKRYYVRKVEEGKSKMTVINNIRAKLIARMFGVIKNNTHYQTFYLNSLA